MEKKHKVWVEVKKAAISHNAVFFRNLVGQKTKIWAVVKSNAYGHGLVGFSLAINDLVDGFCVDSVVEAMALRREGIGKPILVLGPTLPDWFEEAKQNNITLTVSNKEVLNILPEGVNFHLKLDTGMHRQGIYVDDLPSLIENCKLKLENCSGVYTHFASAKDINYPTYTESQFAEFQKAVDILEKSGLNNLIKHVAATGATLIDKKYHLDVVRLGIGLYGLWPSKELALQVKGELKPVLSWKTLISEIKSFRKGDYIGYDLVEKVTQDGRIAILPIGYWHGLRRSLSGPPAGAEVLINGKRARILGKVSMDLAVVDVSNIDCAVGDEAVIIGASGDDYLPADEVARRAGTIHYELITCINPLTKRVIT